MSDAFDPYAYAQGQGQTQAPAFDPYQYAAASASNPNYVPPTMGGGNTWGDVIAGVPQAIESGINRWGLKAAGIPMDAATYVANLGKAGIGYATSKITGEAPPAWTSPSDPAKVVGTSQWNVNEAAKHLGKNVVDVTGDPQSYVLQALNATGEQVGPGVALGLLPTNMAEVSAGSKSLATDMGPQSISAAATRPNLADASPELRQAVMNRVQAGEYVNPDALGRHLQAESLPVPAQLTKGQATQDPILISLEQNQRGASGDFAKHFNAQNQNLIENMETMRDRVGPDVHTTNQVEHGEALIDAYKAKAAAADKDISAKYQALRDANGGKFPVDAKTLYQNVQDALHQKLLFEHAPSAEMAQLKNAAQKGMTFEQYEAMRTNLARVMRSSSDGNEIAAASTMRQQMEDLPMLQGARSAKLKPLADAARAAAKAQFDALGDDPAYKAAVQGKVSPDRFVSRFIVNGNRDDVATMRENFADNPQALQTMSTAALEHLRKSARLDDEFRGNFASQSYNNALQAMGPKLRYLFTPQHVEDLENIGAVARYETAQPKGSFVNNSNTDVARFAREKGADIAEGIANAKTFGIGGTLARRFLKGRAERALAQQHLAPGAGLDYQPSVP